MNDPENTDSLRHEAQRWVAQDPDPETRQVVADALADGDAETLARLFAGRIGFGTAGLRAPMGPGPLNMNSLVVRQTTAGLMSWLEANPFVVVGFDARANSRRFAEDVVGVVAALGGRAAITAGPVPTPVLANAVLDLGASAGVMITASHNPAADNGYKLYLRDGIQLVSPSDAEIAAAIDDKVSEDEPPPWVELSHPTIEVLGSEVFESHIEVALGVLYHPELRTIASVYTAMHGVGGQHFVNAMDRAGFEPAKIVRSQFEPDPTFPTVKFPNPEEPGAMAEAFATVDEGTDVIVAHDPDADRLSLAVPNRDRTAFVQLSGDQVGMLLAEYIMANTSGPRIVASSVVSSRVLCVMAAAAGVECATTLTGFKWVARPMVDRIDVTYLLGYEEALGYAVSPKVRDKDGITAGLLALEMLASYRAQGLTVWDRLDAIAAEHGLYLQKPISIRISDDSDLTAASAVTKILGQPPVPAGCEVSAVHDMGEGYLGLAPTPGVVVMYDDETRVIVRPSGTEPKVKIYIEVIEHSGDAEAGEERLTAFASSYTDALQS